MPETRIGISGWGYEPWRNRFYPKGLPQNKELFYASRVLNSIELNGSFYSLQKPGSYQQWHDETPDDFVFSLKGGQYITHIRRLREIESPLSNFFASGLLCLKRKLGPILWQFPPNFSWDRERFESFFKLLPHDTNELSKSAAKHEAKMKGRVAVDADERRPVRHAIEIRNESFLVPDFFKLLRDHNIAFVIAETGKRFPYVEDVTADFIYSRMHGDEELYASGYTEEALEHWAKCFAAWRKGGEPKDPKRIGPIAEKRKYGRDLFIYFDNDVKVLSPANAMELAKKLGVKWEPDDLKLDELLKKGRGSKKEAIPKPRKSGFVRTRKPRGG